MLIIIMLYIVKFVCNFCILYMVKNRFVKIFINLVFIILVYMVFMLVLNGIEYEKCIMFN